MVQHEIDQRLKSLEKLHTSEGEDLQYGNTNYIDRALVKNSLNEILTRSGRNNFTSTPILPG